MCENCWIEYYDSARIDTPLVRAAAAAIEAVYDYSMSGGRLHVIIDDFNLEDHNIEFAVGYLQDNPAETPAQHQAEEYCLGLLKSMSIPERASALALKEGFWQ